MYTGSARSIINYFRSHVFLFCQGFIVTQYIALPHTKVLYYNIVSITSRNIHLVVEVSCLGTMN